MRNKNGITLIALIVTIIVLLILAGVTLNLITGENGILGETTEAVKKNNNATAQEEIKLAVAEKTMKYYRTNQTKDLITYMNEELKNYTTASGKSITCINGEISYDGTQMATIDEKGNVSIKDSNGGSTSTNPSLASQITANNYGDRINYSANGIEDWKVFYKEGNNVFIITSDGIDNTKIGLSATGLTVKGNAVYWSDGPDNLQTTSQLSLFKTRIYIK